ncbi:MAG: thioesterase family protein [Pseudomonadales bacterium]|nr:thioesterase family protein [Pseudomonadales bacterium]
MRVSIEFPENVIFNYSMTITKAHENSGGHLAHDKVVTIIGDCRDAWFESMGFPGCIVESIGIVNSDLMLMYIAEGFHNDELGVELALGDMNKYGGDMLMRATRTHDDQELFRAKSGFVFYDYQQRKVTKRPTIFDQKAGINENKAL